MPETRSNMHSNFAAISRRNQLFAPTSPAPSLSKTSTSPFLQRTLYFIFFGFPRRMQPLPSAITRYQGLQGVVHLRSSRKVEFWSFSSVKNRYYCSPTGHMHGIEFEAFPSAFLSGIYLFMYYGYTIQIYST